MFAGFTIHWTTPPKTNNPPLQDSGSWKQNDTLSRFLSSTTTTMLNFNWCNVNWSPINLKTNTSKQHRCGCGSPSYTGTLPSTSHGKNRRNGIMFENSTHNHRTFPSKKYYKLGCTNKYYKPLHISKSPKTSYHLFFWSIILLVPNMNQWEYQLRIATYAWRIFDAGPILSVYALPDSSRMNPANTCWYVFDATWSTW